MTNHYATRNTLLFLGGFAAGGTAALLLAPADGRRTRRRIVRTVEDTQDYLTDLGEDLIDRGQELIRQKRHQQAA